MPRIVRTDDAITLDAPPLALAFRWDGERWSHVLSVAGRPVAVTLEGDAGRDDPGRIVSPAFQQAGTDDGPDDPRAMLVGQWGKAHCSAVFSARDTPGADGSAALTADVAVRTREPLTHLASTYLVDLGSGDLADADPRAITWALDGPSPGRLRFEAGDLPGGPSILVGLAEAGRRSVRVQAGLGCGSGPVAATRRLIYRWRWTPARPISGGGESSADDADD